MRTTARWMYSVRLQALGRSIVIDVVVVVVVAVRCCRRLWVAADPDE